MRPDCCLIVRDALARSSGWGSKTARDDELQRHAHSRRYPGLLARGRPRPLVL